jgi:photosystem II stability/assembly factor-like uncharacterized protein
MSTKVRIYATLLVILTGFGASCAQAWEEQNPSTRHMNAVGFIDANRIAAVGNSGYAVYSTDGGTSWTETHTPVNQTFEALSIQGSVVIAVGGGKAIVRSGDGGATWVDVYTASNTLKKATASFIDATTVLAVGAKGTIVRNTASGGPGDWTQVDGNVPPNDDLHAVAATGAHVVVVGNEKTGSYNIVYSDNKGAAGSWSNAGPVGGADLYATAFVNSSTVIAVGANGTILRNTNSGVGGVGGANWAPPNSVANNPGADLNLLVASGTTVVAAGTGGVIMFSHNSGADWDRAVVADDSGQALNDLAISSSLVMAVGDAGTILSSTTHGATWTSETSNPAVALNGVDIINPVVVVGNNGSVFQSDTQTITGGGTGGAGGGLWNGSDGSGNQVVDAPFGGEWLLLLVVLGYGLYRIR